ncbi:MAG: T9SS type A sorting domain-containing protein [Saprospirales bacterium]|nr:T9SS type A sorting domain-containing protein [Saprospirales bacterium]
MKKSLFLLLFCTLCSTAYSQNWQPMAAGYLPTGYTVYSVSALGDKIVWATASLELFFPPIPTAHQIRVLRSSDGGQTWTSVLVEEAAGTVSYQIVAVDSLTAWLTTQDQGSGAGKALYQTTDGGINWVKKLQDPGAGVSLSRFADGQHWLAHNRTSISRSSDNTVNWSSSSITGYQTNEYQTLEAGSNMAGIAGDTLWNGTTAGRIIRFTDYGASYQFLTTGLGSNATISSVAFQDHRTGLLNSNSGLGSSNQISRSADGGAGWTKLANQPDADGIWNIAAVPGAPGFYVLTAHYLVLPQLTAPAKGKVAITTNAGDSWAFENFDQPLNAVAFTSPSTGWIGSGRILSFNQPAILKYTGSPLVGTKNAALLPIGFSVSPNPVADEVVVQIDAEPSERFMFRLTDLSGKTILEATVRGSVPATVDMSHLPAGMYFAHVLGGARSGVCRVVKL